MVIFCHLFVTCCVFIRCDASCFGCSGPGERNCTSCPNGYILDTGVCVVGLVCKDGKYFYVRPNNFLVIFFYISHTCSLDTVISGILKNYITISDS